MIFLYPSKPNLKNCTTQSEGISHTLCQQVSAICIAWCCTVLLAETVLGIKVHHDEGRGGGGIGEGVEVDICRGRELPSMHPSQAERDHCRSSAVQLKLAGTQADSNFDTMHSHKGRQMHSTKYTFEQGGSCGVGAYLVVLSNNHVGILGKVEVEGRLVRA